MRRLTLLLMLGLAGTAAAQTYTVERTGGPFDLSARLEAAATSWNQAAETVDLEEAPGGATAFTFSDSELLGPDVVSATLVREGEEGFDVWLNPATVEEFPQALLHELGLLLGLPAAETGVMAPALSTETPDVPTEADLQALTRALARAGGDIDGDGDVDISDLADLGRAYGQEGVNLAADLNGDGEVDADDVALLRENYTFTVPQPIQTEEPPEEQAPADGPLEFGETTGEPNPGAEGDGPENRDAGAGDQEPGDDAPEPEDADAP